jgi:glycerol-3-phosphate acyltransferase PlsY
MDLAALYIYAYLVGSVPTAYIIARMVKGIDIRRYGSGNIGGSNLIATAGKGWAVPLGLFELFAKGASPIWIGTYVLDLDKASPALMVAPLLAVAGNNWSVYLKFTGGRGIAVALGALFALAYKELIVFVAVGLAGWAIFRSSGIWVLIALALLPLWSLLLSEPRSVTWFTLGLLGLVSAKRLMSNWTPVPEGEPRTMVYLNRLLNDRDVSNREDWISRRPTGRDGETR